MGYTNSPLVSYTKLSPNNSGTRTHGIDRITPHCVVGQLSTEGILSLFTSYDPKNGASCNYCIGADGRVGLGVPESERSWCSSSRENDQRAITIECASDKTDPYAFRDAVYEKLITLCADICRRNGKTKLLWMGDKAKTLSYTPTEGEMVLTVHRWFAAKACPGDWMYSRMGDLAAKVTAELQKTGTGSSGQIGTQAFSISDLASEQAKAAAMLELVHKCDTSGILNSVTTAQMILESGYCGTDLAKAANNVFGMKASLSGNTWPGSTWDGVNTYTKKTAEQKQDGTVYYVTADFRKYPCVEDSIRDHAAYLLGAKSGFSRRYAGMEDAKTYQEAIHIIKSGGYATDTRYEAKICGIIERYGLDKYDGRQATPDKLASHWIVQAGSYNNEANADAQVENLKAKGIDAFKKEVR